MTQDSGSEPFGINIQSNLFPTATLGTLKLRPLLPGGRCSKVGYTTQFVIGPSNWWPLLPGGRYSEVAVSSGSTVLQNKN